MHSAPPVASDHAGLANGVLRLSAHELRVGYAVYGVARAELRHACAETLCRTCRVQAQREPGGGGAHFTFSPWRIMASHGATPAAATRTSTSPAPGSGAGTSCTSDCFRPAETGRSARRFVASLQGNAEGPGGAHRAHHGLAMAARADHQNPSSTPGLTRYSSGGEPRRDITRWWRARHAGDGVHAVRAPRSAFRTHPKAMALVEAGPRA